MPHILVAGAVHPNGLALLDAAPGITYDYVEAITEPDYAPLIDAADGLVIRTQPLTAGTIGRAARLRVVSRHGVGYDSVDLPALNARGITLAVVGDVNSVSVAEHAMMLLLACAKRARAADAAVRDGRWTWRNGLEPVELWGKRLLVVGYGRSGRHLARMAAGFGMEVRAHDPLLARWPEGPVAPMDDIAAGIAWADFVSIHAPKTGGPLIGPAELAGARPGSIFVNTARGGIIDEAALVDALRDGRIAAAGLDVFEDEPPAPDSPLLGLDNLLLSPHVAGLTAECAERMAVDSVRNVLDFFTGGIDPALVINGDALHGN